MVHGALPRLALLFAVAFGMALGVPAVADLKAVFAFGNRVLSIRFPEFNYGILTTVDEESRRIAVSFPRSPFSSPTDAPPAHLEIQLERLPAQVKGVDYHQHYIDRYAESMGTTTSSADESVPGEMSLTECYMTFLLFNDAELRAHKALLITSTSGDLGIAILLDTVAESYEANKAVWSAILRSIQFEG